MSARRIPRPIDRAARRCWRHARGLLSRYRREVIRVVFCALLLARPGGILGLFACVAVWWAQGAVWRLSRRVPEVGWAAGALALYLAMTIMLPALIAELATLGIIVGLVAHPRTRRALLAHRRLTRQRWFWRRACTSAGLREPERRTHPQKGRSRVTTPERPEPYLASATLSAVGLRLRVLLRGDLTAEDVERARPGLAAAYGARSITVVPDASNAASATIDVAYHDPLAAPVRGPWVIEPSLWKPTPIGVDQNGEQVAVRLPEHNVFISGEPGAGKTVAEQLLAAGAAADPHVDLFVIDGKEIDYEAWRPLCRDFAGADVREAIEVLRHAQAWMRTSYKFLREQGLRKTEPGWPLALVVVDELAYFLGAKQTQAEQFAESLRDLVQRGRAAGVIVVAATQRPASDIVPTSLRDLFAFRLTFRTTTPQASDMGMGAGWAAQGYDASTIPSAQRGTAYLLAEGALPRRLRTYALADDDLATILERAAASRGVVAAAPSGPAGGLPPGGGNGPLEEGGRVASAAWQGPGGAPGDADDDSAAAVGGDLRAVQASPTPTHDELAAALAEHLNGAPIRQSDLARRVGRKPSDGTVRRALKTLEADGRAVKTPKGWVRG